MLVERAARVWWMGEDCAARVALDLAAACRLVGLMLRVERRHLAKMINVRRIIRVELGERSIRSFLLFRHDGSD